PGSRPGSDSDSRIDVELDLVAVGIAHGERARRLAERREPVLLDPAPGGRERGERAPDVEGDVIEARYTLRLRPGALGARQLARDVVMVDAGREEDDAPALARAGLGEPEEVAIEASRRREIAHEEGNVTELADLQAGGGCTHGDEECTIGGAWLRRSRRPFTRPAPPRSSPPPRAASLTPS